MIKVALCVLLKKKKKEKNIYLYYNKYNKDNTNQISFIVTSGEIRRAGTFHHLSETKIYCTRHRCRAAECSLRSMNYIKHRCHARVIINNRFLKSHKTRTYDHQSPYR